VLRDYALSGDLCPAAQTTVSLSGTALALYGSHLVQPGNRTVTATCKLSVSMSVPAGYTVGEYPVTYGVFNTGTAEMTQRYRFVEGGSAGPFTESYKDLTSDDGQHTAADHVQGLWSPTCSATGSDQLVHLEIEVSVRLVGGTSEDPSAESFQLNSIDAGFGYSEGSAWKACNGMPASVSGGSKGVQCDALPGHLGCAAGLMCDLTDTTNSDADLVGECVDPNERLAPQSDGAHCGGARMTRCDTGFTCNYTTQDRALAGTVGHCRMSIGVEGGVCGGYPEITCGEGLFCSSNERTGGTGLRFCVRGGGQEGSGCEDGVSGCATGLTCVNRVCQMKVGLEGSPCGPDSGTRCGGNFTCDPDSQTCLPTVQHGQLNALCKSAADCDQGLVCRALHCALPLSGEAGEKCATNDQCQSGLVCLDGRTCAPRPDNYCYAYDSECAEGLVCLSHQCRTGFTHALGGTCTNDDDCSSGLRCVDTYCAAPAAPVDTQTQTQTGCADDSDCGSDMLCLDSQCVSLTDVPADQGFAP
jgi:hypothetical protein